jgi:hypothetical protein
VLQDPVDDTGPVEPRGHGEAPGDGGGLEAADLLHPPDVQLQVRAARGQRVQPVPCAPGEEAAQIGCGVLTGGALEPGQLGGHGQPELVSERPETIGRDESQVRRVHHDLTLRPHRVGAKVPSQHQARQMRSTRSPVSVGHGGTAVAAELVPAADLEPIVGGQG